MSQILFSDDDEFELHKEKIQTAHDVCLQLATNNRLSKEVSATEQQSKDGDLLNLFMADSERQRQDVFLLPFANPVDEFEDIIYAQRLSNLSVSPKKEAAEKKTPGRRSPKSLISDRCKLIARCTDTTTPKRDTWIQDTDFTPKSERVRELMRSYGVEDNKENDETQPPSPKKLRRRKEQFVEEDELSLREVRYNLMVERVFEESKRPEYCSPSTKNRQNNDSDDDNTSLASLLSSHVSRTPGTRLNGKRKIGPATSFLTPETPSMKKRASRSSLRSMSSKNRRSSTRPRSPVTRARSTVPDSENIPMASVSVRLQLSSYPSAAGSTPSRSRKRVLISSPECSRKKVKWNDVAAIDK